MIMSARRIRWGLVLGLALATLPVRADDSAVRGREVFDQYKQCVVTVQMVVKIQYGGMQPCSNVVHFFSFNNLF